MDYAIATNRVSVAVSRALPTFGNLQEGVLSDPRALIDEVAICNTVCMHYVCMTSQYPYHACTV